jgi:hypothetical protein
MARKILLIIFVLLIGFAFNEWLNRKDKDSLIRANTERSPRAEKTKTAVIQNEPVKPAPAPVTAKPLNLATAAPPNAAQAPAPAPQIKQVPETENNNPFKNYKSKVPPKVVPFELTPDGIALAYGDIILGVPTTATQATHGVANPPAVKLWENAVIPYHIQPNLPNPERVLAALEMFQGTPITFVKYSGQPDAIVFEPREGHCKSYLGRVGGLQPIWLSDNCDGTEIVHEVMHALGFIHEQSRIDRDQFVEILWDNIEEQYRVQFSIVPEALMIAAKGMPFDYESVMLYPSTTFAKRPGLTTIRAVNNSAIAPAPGLSKLDIEKLYKLYGSL